MQETRPEFEQPISEDCLSLNIWTPSKRSRGATLPVMVWIHGGGFMHGAGSQPTYEGTRLAQHDVVLVTLNYRLGRFGFFVHPALDGQGQDPVGNYGLMDQIAALKWVRENIRAFGGDPANVTVFGESAGGVSVNYLMVSPAARGLFDKAISQSGFGRARALPLRPPGARDAESMGVRFAERLGIKGDDAAAAAALRALPAEAVNAPFQGLADPDLPLPIIDGRIVTQSPPDAFAKREQAHVPFMVGGVSYEASLFPDFANAPEPVLAKLGPSRDRAISLYGVEDLGRTASAITTDTLSTEPNRYLARQMEAAGQPTFLYYFSYVPPAQRATSLGAAHADELPYVFGNLPSRPFTPPGGLSKIAAAGPEDRATSQAMMAYWTAFAKTGDPGRAGGPPWPRYTTAADALLEFGIDGVQVVPSFNKDRLDWVESMAVVGRRATPQ